MKFITSFILYVIFVLIAFAVLFGIVISFMYYTFISICVLMVCILAGLLTLGLFEVESCSICDDPEYTSREGKCPVCGRNRT